jgi:histone demethylase JARID1
MSSKKGPKGFIECPQVPVFQPTEEEWRTPLEYLASLRRQVEHLGMAKIVPPSGWEPSFTMDRKKTKFKTHIQSIHELQCKDSVAEAKQFWAKYNAFQESAGNKSRRKPLFSGQEIDLYRLYRLVTRRGGYKEVCDGKRWKDIVTAMEVRDTRL